jgi:hypothetical protein
MKNSNKFLATLAVPVLLFSCEKNEIAPVVELEAVMVENVEAPGDVINRTTGEVEQVNPFVYYSLETNSLVNSVEENWDIGFKGTTIIVNNGVSGPGQALAAMVQGTFEEINEVPAALTLRSDTANEFAIPTGSGNGWYNYNPASNIVSPIPGSIMLIKTNAGDYAKIEILSYYKNNPPLSQVDGRNTPRAFYTFQYVLQQNGSRNF